MAVLLCLINRKQIRQIVQTNLLETMYSSRAVRSASDIEQEIATLVKLRERIPAETAFGDSNHHALAAQVDVLRRGLTIHEVRSSYGTMEQDTYIQMCATFAAEWLSEDALAPSEDWMIMLYADTVSATVN